MICVRRRELIYSPKSKQQYLGNATVLAKFKDDFVFEFDKTEPLEWKKFLEKMEDDDGNKLIMQSPSGVPYRYDVYIFGQNFIRLFPGVNKAGKPLDARIYGVLDL